MNVTKIAKFNLHSIIKYNVRTHIQLQLIHFTLECWEPDIPYGRLTTGSDTVFDGRATVECDPGFEVIGSNVATCLFDGNWDTLPTCQPKGK